jgi:hypothetical protein
MADLRDTESPEYVDDQEQNPYYQAPQGPPEGSFRDTLQSVRGWRQDLQKRFARKKPAVETPPIEKPPVLGGEVNKASQNIVGKTAKELEEKALGSSLKGVERKAITGAGRKVATQSAEQIGKTVAKGAATQGAKTLARVGAEAAAGVETVGVGFVLAAVDLTVSAAVYAVKKWWPYILTGVAVILLLPALIFGLKGGGGLDIKPTTEGQQQQAVLIAALSGNNIGKDKAVNNFITSEKSRYDKVQKFVDRDLPLRSLEVKQKITLYMQTLDQILAQKNVDERKKLLEQARKQLAELDSSLPFGKWIAQIAITKVGQENKNFCQITGAGENVACASFSSTVLYEAGVPGAIVGTTTALWRNANLGLVIDRRDQLSNDNLQLDKMHAGDIVWFGNGDHGGKQRYAGALFEHVGIYIGNGEIVDSGAVRSNGQVIDYLIHRRSIRTHKIKGGPIMFNGAKRYGQN